MNKIILFMFCFLLAVSCDNIIGISKVTSKKEWLELKEKIQIDWDDYQDGKLEKSVAFDKFVDYADIISESEIIPPQARYDYAISLYREALSIEKDEEVKEKLKELEDFYKVVNLK